MCSAMLGAAPVKRCTCAASLIFSYGLRGTPGCGNTLNRGPELPNAHDGNSIGRVRSCSRTPCLSDVTAQSLPGRLRQVKYFGNRRHALVWIAVDATEEPAHLGLPAVVDLADGHALTDGV